MADSGLRRASEVVGVGPGYFDLPTSSAQQQFQSTLPAWGATAEELRHSFD